MIWNLDKKKSLEPMTTTKPDQARPEPSTTDDGTNPLKKPRLLLVEDDWRTHSALRKIFTSRGWEVDSAMTVAGGISMLKQGPSGLILDMMLPDGDGLAVLQKVRTDRLAIKVVVTTGIEDPVRLNAIHGYKPDALLRKPVDLGALLEALDLKPSPEEA